MRTRGLGALVVVILGLHGAAPAAIISSQWATAVSGLWTDAARWNPATVPNNSVADQFDVTIGALGTYTVSFSTGSATVNSLALNASGATFALSGGTLSAGSINLQAGTMRFSGGALSGTMVDLAGGTLILTGANLWTNSSVLNGDVVLDQNNASARFLSGSRFTGNATLSASGNLLVYQNSASLLSGQTVHLQGSNSRVSVDLGGSLTINAGAEIRGRGSLLNGGVSGGAGTFLNNGVISADIGGASLSISPTFLANAGTIRGINGGTISISATNWSNSGTVELNSGSNALGGNWTNTGTLALAGGTLVLDGTFTSASIAPARWNRTGGTVNLSGLINNAVSTLTINAQTGDLRLAGGTISGGTISRSGGELVFSGTSSLASDATLLGDLLVDQPSGRVRLFSGARFTGDASLTASNNIVAYFYGANLLAGQTVNLEATNATLSADLGGSLTIDAGAVVRGRGSIANGAMSGGAGTFVNNGVISSDIAASRLTISPTSLTNNGLIRAINGGTISISATNWSNSGAIELNAGSNALGGNWTNTGTLALAGGTLVLDGTFTSASIAPARWNRTGGTVNVIGFVDNASSTLTVNAQTGDLVFAAGTISGGTISRSGGQLIVSGIGNLRDNAVLLGDLLLDQTSGRLRLFSGARFTGDASLTGSNSIVSFLYAGSLLAGQTVNLEATSATLSADLASTLTIDAGAAVRGRGSITSGAISGGAGTLINNGLISADIAASRLTISPTSLTNNGLIRTVGDSSVSVLATNWSNSGTLELNAGSNVLGGNWTNTGTLALAGGTLVLDGTFTSASIAPSRWNRAGGTANLTGFVDNASSTLTVNAQTGDLVFAAGTISGGTISRSGGELIVSGVGNLRDNAVLLGDLTLDQPSGRLRLISGARFTGDATLTGPSSIVAFLYPANLLAGQTVNLEATNATLSADLASTLTIDAGAAVRGRGSINNGAISGGTGAFVNNGVISADIAASRLTISPTLLTNNSLIRAVNGGEVSISATNWSNSGTLELNSGSNVLGGNWTNTGTLALAGGTLVLDGTFTSASVAPARWNRTGGTVNITGFIDNASSTLTVNAQTGDLRLAGGTISGGTISRSGGQLVVASASSLTSDATLLGDLLLDQSTGRLRLISGARFTGDASLTGSSSIVAFLYPANLLAGQTVNLEATNATLSADLGGTLTIDAGAAVRGRGSITNGAISGGTGAFVNNGAIVADLGGALLSVAAPLANASGVLTAQGGGRLHIASLTGSLNDSSVDGLGGELLINGGVYEINEPFSVTGRATAYFGGAWTRSADIDASGRIAFDYALAEASPLADIAAAILSGYAGGLWNGPGIFSTAAAGDGTTGVGYGEASAVLGPLGGGFSGVTVDGSAVLVRWTYLGDANLDGKVDITDLGIIASNWQSTNAIWAQGDFTYNGAVDVADLGALATNWQRGVTGPLTPGGSFDAAVEQAASAIPEPAAGLLLAFVAGLLRRR